MFNSRMILPQLLAGVVGCVLTVALEQLISPLPTGAQPLPPVVRAQRFELVDATGAARAVLRMASEGTGPEVALLDEAGQRRATMTQNSEGEYAFLIFDPGDSLRFGVGTTKRGFVGLNVRDGHGVIRSNLYANDDGSDTGFRTWDADGRVRTKLGSVEGDPSTHAVRVFDEQSQVLWQAP